MRAAHAIKLLFIAMLLLSCKAEPSEDYQQEQALINIQLIRDRCDSASGPDELDCLKDYAGALSSALNEYVNVEVYEGY